MTLKGHAWFVTKLVLFNNEVLCSASFDKSIKFWDIKSGKCITTLKGPEKHLINDFILYNGSLLSVGDGNAGPGNIMIWN